MKVEELKQYIRKTIQQELRTLLKEELKSQLAEILLGNGTGKTAVSENYLAKSESMLDEPVEPVAQKPKKTVKYTNNPVLNEILNQTSGGVPREGEIVGYEDGGVGSIGGREQINEVKAPENAPESVKTVVNAMNRDYRALLKAVDKKKSK